MRILSLLSFALLASCVTDWGAFRRYQPDTTSVAEAELAPFRANGTASVVGDAFVKTRGGDVKSGAGCTVTLRPMNAFTREYVANGAHSWLPARSFAEPDASAQRHAQADGQGRFEFHNLPDGEWAVTCVIEWSIAGQYGPIPTGGLAWSPVTTKAGTISKVVVTTRTDGPLVPQNPPARKAQGMDADGWTHTGNR